MSRRSGAWILAAALVAGSAAAQTVVTTVNEPILAVEAVGSHHREAVNRGYELAQAGQLDQAMAAARPAIAYCDEQLAREGIRFVSVVDATEYRAYMAGQADGVPTEWLDIACAGAYTLAGFVHAGQKQMEAALPFLERAIAIAPYYPNPRTEKGFVLNQLGRHDEAIAIYREVIGLGERHPSAAHLRGMALRGIGWALVEQGELETARQAYEESLVADPGNPTALGELEYIAQQRAAGAESTSGE